MFLDTSVYMWIHSLSARTLFLDHLIIYLAVYLPLILGAIALGYVILSNRSRTDKITALLSAGVAALLSRYVVTAGIRLLLHRARPFTLPNAQYLFKTTGTSFPSAHATILFAAGTVLFAYNKRAGILFYIFSFIVCFARVAAGVHYPSDILAGMFVGTLSAIAVLWYVTPLIRKYVG